ALAEMLRTGWYRAVYVKSEDSHRLKAMLGARDQLVRAKRALSNQVRGVLRPFGIRLPSRQGTKKFAEAAHQAVRRDNMLHASVTALLETLAAIEGQIARLDEQLKELARRSRVCWRLMSVPGVGPIVALAFISAIEDINRFRRMRSVGAYLGLTTAGRGRVHAPMPPTIKGPNRPTCSVQSAPNAEPAPPSCCRPATPKLCSFTLMRSQPKSRRALTLFSSSIKPGGMAPRPSRFQTTSRSCSSRHVRPNSTAKKISGNSCGRIGCRTEFSNPSTTSSITAATPGTRSSISCGKSGASRAAIGQPQVTQSEDWY